MCLARHASGDLATLTSGDVRGRTPGSLTGDPQVQEAPDLDAYARCYAKRTQAAMVLNEHQLIADSLHHPAAPADGAPLAMPVILFSATTGQPQPDRDRYTAFHAALIASLPAGRHVVLAGTTHAMNQERPTELAEAIISLLDRP